jgi:hypothetical protein
LTTKMATPTTISPKVSVPALILAAIGLIGLVAGAVVGDDTITTIGFSALAASGITGGAGYAARPGDVVPLSAPPTPSSTPTQRRGLSGP